MPVPMDNGKPNISMLAAQYMEAHGMPSNAQNMSRALAIVSQQLQNSPQTQVSKTSVPQPQGQAQGPGQPSMPVPPIPPPPSQQLPGAPAPATVMPPSSPSSPMQPPQDNTSWLSNLMQLILGGGAGALAGHVSGQASGSSAEPMGNQAMPPTGRTIDMPQTALPGQQQQQITGPPAQTDDALESALFKALNGGEAAPSAAPSSPQAAIAGPQGALKPQQAVTPFDHTGEVMAPERPLVGGQPNVAKTPPIINGVAEHTPSVGFDWGKILDEAGPLLKRIAH